MPASALDPFSTYSPDAENLINKGKITYRKMLDVANNPGKCDTGKQSISPLNWKTAKSDKGFPLTRLSSLVYLLLRRLSLPQNFDETFIDVINDARWKKPVHSIYFNNMYSAEASMIIARQNYGVNSLGTKSPNRWSDVVFAMFKKNGGTNLRYIVREEIINGVTKDLIDEILPPENERTEEVYGYTIYPDEDMFYGFLQSPNVIGAAYICIRYPVSMQSQRIVRINPIVDVVKGIYYMVIEFGH